MCDCCAGGLGHSRDPSDEDQCCRLSPVRCCQHSPMPQKGDASHNQCWLALSCRIHSRHMDFRCSIDVPLPSTADTEDMGDPTTVCDCCNAQLFPDETTVCAAPDTACATTRYASRACTRTTLLAPFQPAAPLINCCCTRLQSQSTDSTCRV